MTDLLYNIDSVEVAYGDSAFNMIVQIQERITDIHNYLQTHNEFNDFEKIQLDDRLNKLIALNIKIQDELQAQIGNLNKIAALVKTDVKVTPLH